MFYIIIKSLLFLFFKLFYRMRTTGLENIPAEGSLILCANHIGKADPFSVGSNLKRKVFYMAKSELFKWKPLAILLLYLGAFPVKRGSADTDAIKKSIGFLKSGQVLGIYPEGTRNKTDEMLKALPGVAFFAIKTGALIVPVAIKGKYRLFRSIEIKFGKPFRLEHEDRKYHKNELSEMSMDIMNRIKQLMEE